ncbi:hypothetical protein V1515DRAFT_447106 [Lipomyces mesembrius]
MHHTIAYCWLRGTRIGVREILDVAPQSTQNCVIRLSRAEIVAVCVRSNKGTVIEQSQVQGFGVYPPGFSISASAIRLFEVGRYISASVSASRQDGGYPPNPQIRKSAFKNLRQVSNVIDFEYFT